MASTIQVVMDDVSSQWAKFNNSNIAQWVSGAILVPPMVYVTSIVIYRLLFHPLAKYPGPTLAKLTDWYLHLITVLGHRATKVNQWHKKYGSVVRVSPNELSFSDMQSIKDIYGQSANPCIKDPKFYAGISTTGGHTVFNVSDRREHQRIRRMLSDGFSIRSILQSEPMIASKVQQFMDIVETNPSPLNIYELVHLYTVDVVSSLALGRSFDGLSLEEEKMKPSRHLDSWVNIAAFVGLLPWIIHLPTKFFREGAAAIGNVFNLSRDSIEQFRQQLEKDPANTKDVFLKRIMQATDEEENRLSDLDLIENAILFFIGGSGTSASTIVFFLWEALRNPTIKSRLTAEIRDAFPDKNVVPEFKTIESLPYLSNVYDETLRLHGPANASPMPRLSPGKQIGTEYIPARVTVSNLPFTTHRDPKVFPEPEFFDPDRWAEPTTEMKFMYRPFSTGPRNCIGLHQAKVQILLLLTTLIQRFDLTLHPSMTEADMKYEDRGLLRPSGKRFLINANLAKA